MSTRTPAAKQSWRDVLDIHPAADLFPLMARTDPAALKELSEDIKKNHLQALHTMIGSIERRLIGASAIAATVTDPKAFRSGRDFAAWIGLVPRQDSSGNMEQICFMIQHSDFTTLHFCGGQGDEFLVWNVKEKADEIHMANPLRSTY